MDKIEERRLYEKAVLSDGLGALLQIDAVLASRFRKIKEAYFFESDQSVSAMLITTEYERLISEGKIKES